MLKRCVRSPTAILPFVLLAASKVASAADTLEEVIVFARGEPQIGRAAAASEGAVGGADLSVRPLLRVAELLEVVPGMIAVQHSGSGKANQYFLRGFNLDHGTDFSNTIDDVVYDRWQASLRVRHLGEYPLTEDNSRRADAETTVNLRGAWKAEHFVIYAELLNALDEDGKDIVYYYGATSLGWIRRASRSTVASAGCRSHARCASV